jgi:hypothetical protein
MRTRPAGAAHTRRLGGSVDMRYPTAPGLPQVTRGFAMKHCPIGPLLLINISKGSYPAFIVNNVLDKEIKSES